MTNTREENAAEAAGAETAFKRRRRIEDEIISHVIADALASDPQLHLSVEDEAPSRDPKQLLEAVLAVDEAHLYYHRANEQRAFGWVFFVLGNDGWDVICDNTTNIDPLLAGATALADALEKRHG